MKHSLYTTIEMLARIVTAMGRVEEVIQMVLQLTKWCETIC